MKLLFKLIGVVFIGLGVLVNMVSVIAIFKGQETVAGVLAAALFVALGVAIIVINKKGYTW